MKIVVVGGGLAGWIAATSLNLGTEHDIVVIDSSSVGPMGVGEGTTGTFTRFIQTYFSEEEFVDKCQATPKLGVHFDNWHKDTFISPIEGSFSTHDRFDYAFYHGIENNVKHNYSIFSVLSDKGLIDFDSKTTRDKFATAGLHAYHLDTYKTISFLKQKCISAGVEFIDTKVIGNEKKRGNVTKIKCEDRDIECDFVVDCSGFKRVVVSTYNPHFISYEKWLTVNTGLAFNLSRSDFEYTRSTTTAHALSCGWMWMIPNHSYIGCGVVYDDNFSSKDEIVKEVNDILGVEIAVRKEIKFKSGRLRKSLYNNVVSLGPAYSFLEPLQATSIHTTLVQVIKLFSFLNGEINAREYNQYCADIVDNYADFVSLHYQFKYHQNDFWRSRIPRRYTARIINKSKKKIMKQSDYVLKNLDCTANNLWSYILAGGDLLTKKKATYSEEQLNNIEEWKEFTEVALSESMSFSSFLGLYHVDTEED